MHVNTDLSPQEVLNKYLQLSKHPCSNKIKIKWR